MKKIAIVLFAIILLINNCWGQNNQVQGSDKVDLSNYPIFVFHLKNRKEIITRDFLIRTHEYDSVGDISRSDFFKKYNMKSAIVMVYYIKPEVKMISLAQVFNKFNIDEKYLDFTVTANGRKLIDKQTAYASADAIQGVKVDPSKETVNITLKPELKFLKKAP